MKIEILGPSCATCLRLEVKVMQALAELGWQDATLAKVTATRDIERYLVGEPPGLVVDGQVIWAGGARLPSMEEIIDWLEEERERQDHFRPSRAAAEPSHPQRG